MGIFLDSLPMSGIVRIRDMMYTIQNPFRLDQGDVSFDAPESFKQGMRKGIDENHTHYLPTLGLPRLRQADRRQAAHQERHPGRERRRHHRHQRRHPRHLLRAARGARAGRRGHLPRSAVAAVTRHRPLGARRAGAGAGARALGFRWDLDELEKAITPKTKAIYINSPTNPSGGALTRADLERIAELAKSRNLWVFSDEAYEDVLFTGEHVSIASLPGMYERTIPIYTMSKSYAVTGVRVGYIAIKDKVMRARAAKVALYTASNVCSIAQYGAIGALEGPQDCIEEFKTELKIRRDLFYAGLKDVTKGALSGNPPNGAFYAFVKIDPAWAASKGLDKGESLSWTVVEHIIKHSRVGCVPGLDFGPASEGYIRFCTCRDRKELMGALESMRTVFAS